MELSLIPMSMAQFLIKYEGMFCREALRCAVTACTVMGCAVMEYDIVECAVMKFRMIWNALEIVIIMECYMIKLLGGGLWVFGSGVQITLGSRWA